MTNSNQKVTYNFTFSCNFLNIFYQHTGFISQIWTEVQVNIYHIYIASTETNDTSEESSDTQLFETRKSEGVALSGGHHAYLP